MHFSIGPLAIQFFGAPAGMRKNALAEAATDGIAQTIAAARKPVASTGPAAGRTPPSNAVATIPPVRETTLFRPEAEPVCRRSTDARIAVVILAFDSYIWITATGDEAITSACPE
jgi:hypothetical protein